MAVPHPWQRKAMERVGVPINVFCRPFCFVCDNLSVCLSLEIALLAPVVLSTSLLLIPSRSAHCSSWRIGMASRRARRTASWCSQQQIGEHGIVGACYGAFPATKPLCPHAGRDGQSTVSGRGCSRRQVVTGDLRPSGRSVLRHFRECTSASAYAHAANSAVYLYRAPPVPPAVDRACPAPWTWMRPSSGACRAASWWTCRTRATGSKSSRYTKIILQPSNRRPE
jgi:hypothetical protein